MKAKRSPEDFRVTELLSEGYLQRSGPFRVYKVTKRKLTSFEAAKTLADMAAVPAAEIAMAGLKDRQGITVQYMSVRGGRRARMHQPDLTIEPAGFAREALDSSRSLGNAFRIRLRDLDRREVERLQGSLPEVRALGLPNYFDEQRFGNLRHGQGWVALDLLRGRVEGGLRRLLCSSSEQDDPRQRRFKSALGENWGDWRECRELAGKLGAHHSVFDHLRRQPEDFAGAFRRVAQRLRLIHLYAFQSHLWNRSVARLIAECAGRDGACVATSIEGELVFHRRELDLGEEFGSSFRLPGEGLKDVSHPRQRALLEIALREYGLRAEEFQIHGVPGFRFKGEDRALMIRPRSLRLRLPEADRSGPASRSAQISFELPRGAYATLVIKRLFARPVRGRVLLAVPRRAPGRRGPEDGPSRGTHQPARRFPRRD